MQYDVQGYETVTRPVTWRVEAESPEDALRQARSGKAISETHTDQGDVIFRNPYAVSANCTSGVSTT